MRRNSTRLLVLSLAGLLLAACPKKTNHPRPSDRTSPYKIEIFTESAAVQAVIAVGKTLWVGMQQGLVAWDLSRGGARVLTIDDGLPNNNVLALATDNQANLWVATAAGIARLSKGRWSQFGDCPLGDKITTMAASPDGNTIWVGGSKGLARLRHENWTTLYKQGPVTALYYAKADRALWVGTSQHGVLQCDEKRCTRHGEQTVGGPRVTSLAGAGKVLAATVAGNRGDRLVYRAEGRWTTHAPNPARMLHWVNFGQKRLYLAAGKHIFTLVQREEQETPPGDLRLKIQSGNGPEFIAQQMKRRLRSGVTVVRRALGALWIGTRRLGVARLHGDLLQYYRTNDLSQGARRLSLACVDDRRCYLATGKHLFLYDGKVWTRIRYPHDPEAVFQWIGKDPRGGVTAVIRTGQRGIGVVQRAGKTWKAVELTPPIQTKRGPLRASFARFGPGSKLWIGLTVTESGEERGAGAAVVDVATGRVQFHGRRTGLPTAEGSLGIPAEITGAAFSGGRVFLGSRNGVVVIQKSGSVRLYTENDGLASELIKDITVGPQGRIWVATPSGLGMFDGKAWRFETGMGHRASRITAVARGYQSTLWFASNTGLHCLRGDKVTTLDEGTGLLERSVRSLVVAQGRVWALHKVGLSLVTRSR